MTMKVTVKIDSLVLNYREDSSAISLQGRGVPVKVAGGSVTQARLRASISYDDCRCRTSTNRFDIDRWN